MNAYLAKDEHGSHWICSVCDQGDFDLRASAANHCKSLLDRTAPPQRAKVKPLTAKQVRERSQPILGLRKVGRTF